MRTFDRIQSFLEIKNKSQKELCDFLGVSQSVFSGWKAGRIKSYEKYLPQIAEFLGVTVNDLIGTEPTAQDPQITILSRGARRMTEEQKDKLVEMAKLLYPDAFKDE
jgi:transcriptional regulator with XRE-family HTH domain